MSEIITSPWATTIVHLKVPVRGKHSIKAVHIKPDGHGGQIIYLSETRRLHIVDCRDAIKPDLNPHPPFIKRIPKMLKYGVATACILIAFWGLLAVMICHAFKKPPEIAISQTASCESPRVTTVTRSISQEQ